MGYTKHTWVDGTEDDPGKGTLIKATWMNEIENELEALENENAELKDSLTELSSLKIVNVAVSANTYSTFDAALENLISSLSTNTCYLIRFMNGSSQVGLSCAYTYSTLQYACFLYMGTGSNGFCRFRLLLNSAWKDSVSLY